MVSTVNTQDFHSWAESSNLFSRTKSSSSSSTVERFLAKEKAEISKFFYCTYAALDKWLKSSAFHVEDQGFESPMRYMKKIIEIIIVILIALFMLFNGLYMLSQIYW